MQLWENRTPTMELWEHTALEKWSSWNMELWEYRALGEIRAQGTWNFGNMQLWKNRTPGTWSFEEIELMEHEALHGNTQLWEIELRKHGSFWNTELWDN